MDEFEDLKDYEKLYKINKNGEIWSCYYNKILSLSTDRDGYSRFNLNKDNKQKSVFTHRIVAKQFIPNPDNLPVVDHIDRNRLNNNITNLRWVSLRQNQLNKKNNNKYPYIYWSNSKNKYRIKIVIKRKNVYNSYHNDLDQAILVRDAAMILLNFPNDCYTID